ncbi:MAG: ABC transporter permease [Propionibacteriaceae bacterium]|nr:ABC transporter permease [Micropruina sp.]HBY23771.1 sodium transporter [Propionibacteriaceae bacterium]
MKRHNFGTVVSFEFLRTVTKPKFWIITLAVPAFLAIVIGLTTLGAKATNSATNNKFTSLTFTYTDPGHWIVPEVAKAMGGTLAADPAAARAAVQAGTSEANFDYPSDPGTGAITVMAKDVGLVDSAKYAPYAQGVFRASITAKIGDPALARWATTTPTTDVLTYADGVQSPGFMGAIAPGIFMLVFYLTIMMLGNQMLNVTLEEKENRVTEMILTTMNPATLIVGKVVALSLLGVLQAVLVSLPIFLGSRLFGTAFDLPNLDLSQVPITPLPTLIGFLLFVGGFMLFSGLLVAIGSVMPSAREAGSAFGAVILCMFIPLYALSLVVSDPHSVIVQIFTYFPLTAPITAMLRNALGSLSVVEAGVVLVILFATAAAFLWLGVQLFRTGSIAYDRRLNIGKALGLGRKAA